MASIIIRHDEDNREIIYTAKEWYEPMDALYRIVDIIPPKLETIKSATSDKVQELLKEYI